MKPVFSALLLIGASLVSGCNNKSVSASSAAMPPMPVSVIKIEPTDVAVASEWVGTMDGFVNAQIQPQASGYLVRQLYKEGSEVAKDQVLFEIDPRPFQAVLDQTEGQLGQAKAQRALTEINVKRDTPLAEAHAIAQSQLDNEVQQQAQAEASVKTAEAAVETAQLNLSFCQVRSLISGVAGQATVQVGNLVNTQSVLTSVSQLNPIKVYFSISDGEYLALTHQAALGQGDLLKGAANVPLTLTLSNGDVHPEKGHIAFVDRQVNAQTGAIRIAAAFPNPHNILRPGQFGRVKADTEVLRHAILVPQAAVVEFEGQQQVYTVTNDNKVHVNNVVLGPQHGTSWIVESGLSADSRVILDNLQKLREGAPVNPQIAPSQSASAAHGPAPTGR
ncbi:MAG TPA: efflux RND transporter periplasmic adaptor subunit [Terracidiphilus sp.]|nr:efflux RND transporter periplasmic adaptor subunit [Terracidiphilus sp.]